MAYSENKKIGGLDQFTPPLQDNDNIVVEQTGVAKRATLANLFAKLFNITTTISPTTSDSAVVVRQDGSVGKTALNGLVPADSITNTQINSAANISDTKLATIATAGKVADTATSATPGFNGGNTAYDSANNDKIVKRNGSGNFAAGTITATLSGNASTATSLSGGTANSVPYQASAGSTTFLAPGASGTFLKSNGPSSAPSWDTLAATVTSADRLNGGATGQLVYQTGAGTTGFTLTGTNGFVLTSVGAGRPEWVNASSSNSANAFVRRDASGNFSAGTITAALSGNANTATTLSTGRTIAMTGDVAYTSPTFNGSTDVTATATIQPGAVSNEKLRDSAALSVIGRSANSPGDPGDIAAGTDGHVLRRSGTALGFGQVATAGITDGAVTAAKLSGAQGGSAPIYGCRAWVNFDGTTTPPTVRASGNVSSVTRTATGTYVVNFTTAMPDGNCAVCVGANAGSTYVDAVSSSSATIITQNVSATKLNASLVTVSVFR